MKIPTVQESLKITTFEYPSFFVGYISRFDIETMPYTDDCYHDAPMSISITMTIDDLLYLKKQVEDALVIATEIHEKYKDQNIGE
jgi:hypothetical protein